MPLLEKDIEGSVVKWAIEHGFLAPKVRFVEIGYPDRLFISPQGHTIFIEFKRPGKRPEVIQNFRIQQLRKRNIPAYWADTYVEAINILKAALEPEKLPDTSHSPAIVTSIRRAISGPGIGEDIHCPGGDKDFEGERTDSLCSGSGAVETDDGDVAGRD